MDHDLVLRLSSPVLRGMTPIAELGLSTSTTSVRFGADIRGGFTGCTISAAPRAGAPIVGPMPRDLEVPLAGHVEIWSGSRVIYEGRVDEIELGDGGRVIGLTLEGYQASMVKPWWYRTDLTTSMTSGQMLEQALMDLTPWLRPGIPGHQWIDPMVIHPGGMSEVARMTVWEIADLLTQEGDSQGRPVDVMVLADRRVWVKPRIAPAEPDYTIPFERARVSRWTRSKAGMVSSVTVEYPASTTTTVVSGIDNSGISVTDHTHNVDVPVETTALTTSADTAGFVDTYGFTEPELITGGDLSAEAAVALRDRTLVTGSQPRIGITLTARADDPGTWLTRKGTPWPWLLPMPGEWVQVASEPSLPIIAVTIDASAGTATYELGTRDPSMTKNQRIVERDLLGRFARQVSASGGRLR